MTPAQKEIFLIVDEFWKTYGFGPTIDDIMRLTGERGRGNVARKMSILIEIGILRATFPLPLSPVRRMISSIVGPKP